MCVSEVKMCLCATGNSGFNNSIKATVVLSGAHSIGNVRAAKMRNCTQAKSEGLVRCCLLSHCVASID